MNKKEKGNNDNNDDDSQTSASRRAKLIVQLPEDAKLYIDNRPMKTTSARRVFNTPALDKGQVYYYILRVEVVRNGKKKTETKRVLVRAGQETKAAFGAPKTEMVATKTQR
jgi:uncharacterized protein (TIGR03000 family)